MTVDIFVLTYNRLKYLKMFIKMLYLSTDFKFRLYVIDNGSTDGTREFILKLEKEGIIYKHLFNTENLPLASAYTACFDTFRDELSEFVITAPDDIIPPIFKSPSWLEIFVAKMESDESIGCVNFKGCRASYDSFMRKYMLGIENKIKKEGGWRMERFNQLQKIFYDE